MDVSSAHSISHVSRIYHSHSSIPCTRQGKTKAVLESEIAGLIGRAITEITAMPESASWKLPMATDAVSRRTGDGDGDGGGPSARPGRKTSTGLDGSPEAADPSDNKRAKCGSMKPRNLSSALDEKPPPKAASKPKPKVKASEPSANSVPVPNFLSSLFQSAVDNERLEPGELAALVAALTVKSEPTGDGAKVVGGAKILACATLGTLKPLINWPGS